MRASKDDINSLFAMMQRYALTLAQPGLTPDSHLSHLITLRNRSFRLRFTSFVEIMAPCLSGEFLMQVLPTFSVNLSGWGLDYIWASKVTDWSRIGIVDNATMCHTRPVGGPNYRHVANGGKTPHQEMYEALSKYGVTAIDIPLVPGGIDHAGRALQVGNSVPRPACCLCLPPIVQRRRTV